VSDGEAALAFHLRAAGLPEPLRQFHFAPTRRWAADFAFPAQMLLVEVDGGVYIAGGHNRGAAYTDDRERDAEAMCLGYRVLRVTTGQVDSGQALNWIERLLR
jgi:very-short-patch-repair endonuclease